MRAARRTRGFLAVALASPCSAAPSRSASAATNLVSNGTFEGSGAGSLTGWAGSSGTLALVSGNGGGFAARLTASSGASSTYAYTTSKPVKSATAGTAYQLSGDVQSSVPGQSVCLVLKELKSGTTTSVASAQSCLTPTATWQSIPAVNYTVKTTGDSLTVNVLEKPVVTGASFAFDNIVLATGSSGGGGGDTQPPSVPQGVCGDGEQRDVGDGVVVALERQRRRRRLRRLSRRDRSCGPSRRGDDVSHRPDGAAEHDLRVHRRRVRRGAEHLGPVRARAGDDTGGRWRRRRRRGGTGPAEPVIIIMMENKHYSDIVGNSAAPYIQSLIAQGTLYTNYEAAPGSLPDYLANTSGLTGSTSGSDNIFNQLQTARAQLG